MGDNYIEAQPCDTKEAYAICKTPSKYAARRPGPPTDPPRPQRWYTRNGASTDSTYLFANFQLPFAAAQRACAEKGARLAQVDSWKENDELVQKAKDIKSELRT